MMKIYRTILIIYHHRFIIYEYIKSQYIVLKQQKKKIVFCPDDLLSRILKSIKNYIKAFEKKKKKIKKTVINDSAHYNNSQRKATKEAQRNT